MYCSTEAVRLCLPAVSIQGFDDIVSQKILGASTHISMIGEMIEEMVKDGIEKGESTSEVIHRIDTVSQYFIETRGEASQAVSNAIYIMTRGLQDFSSNEPISKEIGEAILSVRNDYRKNSQVAISKVVEYSTNLAAKMDTLFVYDYSSTVDKFLQSLAKDGKKRTVYIAESRIINGGYPFVRNCQESGYQIRFIPDASLMVAIRQSDACFMGAETFYPDGTAFNTTGSDLVGVVCQSLQVPLYFLTPMIKLDIRPTIGKEKNLVYNDVKARLSNGWDQAIRVDEVDFVTPELIGVPPDQIRAFVTELGVIPSSSMFGISMEYMKSLKGVK